MNITKKLSSNTTSQTMKKFKLKQREFERKLQFNINSDPLDLWYKHIVWICENSEHVDDFEKLVTQLIENCIEIFVQNKKYTNDERFFDIFLKYTRLVCDPLEIYESLNSILLFEKIAEFYINWAWLLENSLKYVKSLEVLNLGIARKAKPIQSLIEAKVTLENKMQNVTFSLDKTEEKTNKLNLKLNSNKKTCNKFTQIRKMENSNFKNLPKVEPSIPNKINDIKSDVFVEKTEVLSNKVNFTPFKILEDKVDSSNETEKNDKIEIKKSNQKLALSTIKNEKTIETKSNDLKKVSDVEKKSFKSFKEPKLVIFEVLKPNQKFYADLNKIYCDRTEYSFEELRVKKMLIDEKKKQEEKKERINENLLLNEIKDLKNQLIKAKEEKKKENDNLQKQLDYYKQKLDFLMSTISVTQNKKRSIDEIDYKENSKKLKISNNNNLPKIKNVEKELTIVREMWNGTLENNSNFSGDGKRDNQRDFSIYKDPSQTAHNFKHTCDFIINTPFNLTSGDLNTMQLPSDTLDFSAKMSSTPYLPKKKRKV